MKSLYLFCIAILIISCKPSSTVELESPSIIDSDAPEYVQNIEKAHKREEFLKNESICFTLDMTFGKNNSVMKIFTTTNSSAIRVEKKDGPTTIMNDGNLYTTADSSGWNREKFGIYTYQYFFMLPYKLSEQGTKWQKMNDMEIQGNTTHVAKLSFDAGTGDAPDDWYMVHYHPENNTISHAGYIVTGGGTSQEDAEKNAHAIQYSDYTLLDGVPIARKWEFYDYSAENGLGKKIGEGILKNVLFMDKSDSFEASENPNFQKISD